jgi:hypothetical protein
MTDAKSAWRDTSQRFASLGAKLKLHYEQQRGADADQAKAEVQDALHRLTGALEDAFDTIGTAARDDAVKSDVKQVGQSLVTALGATFTEVSSEVQRAFAHRGGGPSGAGAAAPGTPDTAPSATEPGPAEREPAATTETAPDATDATDATATADDGDDAEDGTDAEDGEKSEPGHETDAGPAGEKEETPRVEPWGTP